MGTPIEKPGTRDPKAHETLPVPVRIPIPVYDPSDQLAVTAEIGEGTSDLALIFNERNRVLREIEMRSEYPATKEWVTGRVKGGLGLVWAINHIPYRLGERFNAHGITLEPVLALHRFLTEGVDRSKMLYSMPFANVGEYKDVWTAPHPHHFGGIIIVSDVDEYLISNRIKFVVLGEEYNRAVHLLRMKYPDFEFVPWHHAPKVLSERLKQKTGETVKVEELDDENKPYYPMPNPQT